MKYLNHDEITAICNNINAKHIPNEHSFEQKLDELFEFNQLNSSEFLRHSFKELLKNVDSEIKVIEEKVDISATCQIGCAHCCYFPIITTALETSLIVNEISKLPDEKKANIIEHLRHYFNVNEQKIQNLCSIDFEEHNDFKYQYIAAQLPCPLLDTTTNTCLAYEVRPIPCRTYLNYSHPNVCKDSFMPKEPFSYEFLHGYYMDSLNEILEAVIYEEDLDIQLEYPNDLFRIDYLPLLLREKLR
ncbi:YkgJ family cysteine cluster protein [Bacillus sp. Marseille-P3661]|uniref:YkgJ family cysteine cluster protein n=1 Tax=Bacillus sp. Marseille-P3661 TaxID=1936234 RepID=UPI0015E17918|nr:YkgJ family cysteine cluster protein [Bacillus sp. Marseille-P3661]